MVRLRKSAKKIIKKVKPKSKIQRLVRLDNVSKYEARGYKIIQKDMGREKELVLMEK